MSFEGSAKVSVPEQDSGRGSLQLTPPSQFSLDYLPVPCGLGDYITTFYHFRCDQAKICDIQPAAIGHLTLFPFGKGRMMFPDGRKDPTHETNLMTPFSMAAPFEVDGPFHAVGAVLTPLGWTALTGLHAAEHANRLYRAGDWLGEEIEAIGRDNCAAYRRGDADAQQLVNALTRFISNNLRRIPARHKRLIEQTNAWLASDIAPDLDELYGRLDYSRRQSQRLLEQYFGLSPVALKRKYRALRAAAYLSLPHLAQEFHDKLASAFFDQPHMIREISLFAGRTPGRLGDEESPFLKEMLNTANLRELECASPSA